MEWNRPLPLESDEMLPHFEMLKVLNGSERNLDISHVNIALFYRMTNFEIVLKTGADLLLLTTKLAAPIQLQLAL